MPQKIKPLGWFFKAVDRWRYRTLLVMLIALFLINPVLQRDVIGVYLDDLLAAFIMIGAIHAAHERRRDTSFASFLAATWLGLLVIDWLTPSVHLRFMSDAAALILCAQIFLISMRTLLHPNTSGSDAISAAIFGYFLLALVWSILYAIIEQNSPGAFTGSARADDFIRGELLYFSLVTQTTLGFGDIAPTTPFARIVSALQACVGTLYIAILIAGIVGGKVDAWKFRDPDA